MVKYEIAKLFHRRQTRFFVLLLCLVNVLVLFRLPLPGVSAYGDYSVTDVRSVYAALPREPQAAAEALTALEQRLFEGILSCKFDGPLLTGSVEREYSLICGVKERVEEAASHGTFLQEVEDNAQTLLLTGIYEDPECFGARNIRKSRQVFRELEGTPITLFYSGAVELLPGGRITDVLLFLFLLLLAMEGLLREKQEGTLSLIRPTARGGFPLLRSKMMGMLLLSGAAVLVLYGSNLLIAVIRCGAPDRSASVQSVFGFQGCPRSMTVGTYVLCFLGMKLLWAWGLCGLCALVGALTGDMTRFLLLLVPVLLPSVLFMGDHGLMGCLSLLRSGDTAARLGEYRNLNCFGVPVSVFLLSVASQLLLLLGTWMATALCHKRLPVVRTKGHRSPSQGKLKPRLSLLHHEGKKLLLLRGGLWILLLFGVVQVGEARNTTYFLSRQERCYMSYSRVLQGVPNEEKDRYLEEEEARFQELLTRLEGYSQALGEGTLDQGTYNILSGSIFSELQDQQPFEQAKSQYERVKAEGLEYVCLSGYERLLGILGQRDLLRHSMLLVLALLWGLASIEAIERESHMHSLLSTTTGYGKVRRYKKLLCALFALGAALFAYAPFVWGIWQQYGLSGFSAPAGSVPQLVLSVGTVGSALGCYALCAVCFSLLCAFVTRRISALCGSTRHTILWASLTLELPLLCILLLSI